MTAELLLKCLEELVNKDLEKFKWFLKQGVDDFKRIPSGLLEDAQSRETLVSTMISRYGTDNAGRLMLIILRKMDHNNLADQFEAEIKREPVMPGVTGVSFVELYESKLIQRVSLVDPIADDLKPLIGNEKYTNIRAATTSQNKMRVLYSYLQGEAVKEKFYQSLLKNEPFLVKELAGL